MSDASQILGRLKDLHLPPAPAEPSIWPALLSLVLIALALISLLYWRVSTRHSWAKTAREQLQLLHEQNPSIAVNKSAQILKQLALTVDGDEQVRKLNGQPWLIYLNEFFGTDYFSNGEGQVFGDALYRSNQTIDSAAIENLIQQLRKLIKRKSLRTW